MKSLEILAILPNEHAFIDDEKLHFVSADGYTAVFACRTHSVIKLPLSRKEALKSAAARQAMLEQIMPLGPVMPFKPDCIVTTDDVPGLVAANAPLFDALSKRLQGKVQFQVAVHWDRERALGEFKNTTELSEIFKSATVAEAELTRAITALSWRLSGQMMHALCEVAAEVLALPMTSDMLMNAVVLQDTEQLTQLDAAIEAIDAIWTEGLRIKQIGPAPAVSFALLDPERINPADVALAERALGVSAQCTTEEINQARKTTILRSPTQAPDAKRSAAILHAASRAGRTGQPIYLCAVRSEDQATSLLAREVA